MAFDGKYKIKSKQKQLSAKLSPNDVDPSEFVAGNGWKTHDENANQIYLNVETLSPLQWNAE